MKKLLFITLIIFSFNLHANCTPEDEKEIKENFPFSNPLKVLNIDNQCRFTLIAHMPHREERNYIAIKDEAERLSANVTVWFNQPTKSSNFRFLSLDGPSLVFFNGSDFKKKKETNYKMNLKDGIETTWFESENWFENGSIESQTNYSNNIPVGIEKIWNKEGKVISERKYKNGVLEQIDYKESSQFEIDQQAMKEVQRVFERNEKANKVYLIESENQKKIAKEKEAKSKNDLIKSAKEKCLNIGYVTDTEKFGKCVLELIK